MKRERSKAGLTVKFESDLTTEDEPGVAAATTGRPYKVCGGKNLERKGIVASSYTELVRKGGTREWIKTKQ